MTANHNLDKKSNNPYNYLSHDYHSENYFAKTNDLARMNALQGKSLVVVGYAVGGHHRQYLAYAKSLGIKIQLLHLRESKEAIEIFTNYNPIDLVDHVISVDVPVVKGESTAKREARVAELAFDAFEKAGIKKKDGVGSFVEEDVVIAALLAQKWGLSHMPPEAVRCLRDKELLRELRQSLGLPTIPSVKISNEAELEKAMTMLGFPAVIKPNTGSHAQGVVLIKNANEARKKFQNVMTMILRDPLQEGDLSVGKSILYMQFLQGNEVDVDFILQDGVLTYSSVTDNHPTLPYSLAPTGLIAPSQLSDKQQEDIVADAVKTALGAGARDGVFHFEGYLTKQGSFVLFDANPRVGGRPAVPINNDVWGVNLIKESFMIWGGIPGKPYIQYNGNPVGDWATIKANLHIYGKIIHTPRAGIFQGIKGWEELMQDPRIYLPGSIILNPIGTYLNHTPENLGRLYFITAKGNSAQEAEANAKDLLGKNSLQVIIE